MRFGCCAKLNDLEIVQSAGYDYIELPLSVVKAESPDEDFEPVIELVQSYDIVPEVWHCLLSADMKAVGPEVDEYRIERYFRTAFERIEELGGEVAVLDSSDARTVPEGFSKDEAREQLTECITIAGQVAGSCGITIALKPIDSSRTNMINRLVEAVELVKVIDHPFVKVAADLYQMMRENEPISCVVEAGNELSHTYIADTDYRCPGSGNYPIRDFLEALRSIGYNDRMTVECNWTDFEIESARALEFLRGLDEELPF